MQTKSDFSKKSSEMRVIRERWTCKYKHINNNKITTKGDVNNIADKPIKRKNIIGKVIFKTTFLGFIVFLFNQPIFWLLIFIIGIITTIIIPREKKM